MSTETKCDHKSLTTAFCPLCGFKKEIDKVGILLKKVMECSGFIYQRPEAKVCPKLDLDKFIKLDNGVLELKVDVKDYYLWSNLKGIHPDGQTSHVYHSSGIMNFGHTSITRVGGIILQCITDEITNPIWCKSNQHSNQGWTSIAQFNYKDNKMLIPLEVKRESTLDDILAQIDSVIYHDGKIYSQGQFAKYMDAKQIDLSKYDPKLWTQIPMMKIGPVQVYKMHDSWSALERVTQYELDLQVLTGFRI